MKLDYTLLALAVGLLYAIVAKLLPDFPLSQDVVFAIILYVLAKLGVEIVGQPLRAWLIRKGLMN